MEMIRLIQQKLLILADTECPTLVLGLSGGLDSVVLFHILQDLHVREKIRLVCVHINHGWRDTAHNDQLFCEQLCDHHSITLTTFHAEDILPDLPEHKKAHASQESLAREIRRVAFEKVAHDHNAHGIVLAHHADDQLETFFFRLLRGTSLAGLCGMRPRSGNYLRPLLSVTKSDLKTIADAHHFSYCHDETNQSMSHLRNRIRKNALPALLGCDERAEQSIHNTIARLQDDDRFLEHIADTSYNELVDDQGKIPRPYFMQLHRALQVRLLLRLFIAHNVAFTPSTRFFDEILRFLRTDSGGQHAISRNNALQKKRGFFGVVEI